LFFSLAHLFQSQKVSTPAGSEPSNIINTTGAVFKEIEHSRNNLTVSLKSPSQSLQLPPLPTSGTPARDDWLVNKSGNCPDAVVLLMIVMGRRKLIVALSGATGSIFGVRLLQTLHNSQVETHLVMSKWAGRTLTHETPYTVNEIKDLATEVYSISDQGAAISSGSFLTDGMVVIPCSMRTLSAISHSQGDNLLHRAADVILKEHRKLVLVVREAPLHEIHLENMLRLAKMGVTILPPVPAFYNHPQDIDDLVNHVVGRVLDQFEIPVDIVKRWDGIMSVNAADSALGKESSLQTAKEKL
jgi:flavin prenyltransferase